VGIVDFPHDSQASGNGALADGENRSSQQDLRVFSDGLGKNRLKLHDEWQQPGRQCSHIEDVFGERFFFSLRGLSFLFQ